LLLEMFQKESRLLVRSAAVILVFLAVRNVDCATLPPATTSTVPASITTVPASTTTVPASTLISACFVAKFTKIKHSFNAEFNLTVQMPILPVKSLHIHGGIQVDLNIENFPTVPGSSPKQYRDPQGNVYTPTDDGWDVDGGECSCDSTTSPD